VGGKGDSYDNALAESVNGLYKPEVIRRCVPRRGFEDVEFATLEWYDTSRLQETLGRVSPAEFEEALYDRKATSAEAVALT